MTPPEPEELPIWARPEAFPPAPEGCGWVSARGVLHPCSSFTSLLEVIRNDQVGNVQWIWVPDHPHLILPEESPPAFDAMQRARQMRADINMLDSTERLRWYGTMVAALSLYMFYRGWQTAHASATPVARLLQALDTVMGSMSVGLTLLMFLIFAFVPWYQSRKRLRELERWGRDKWAALIPTLRFETWLQYQRAPATKILLGLIASVALIQIFGNSSGAASWLGIFQTWNGIQAAGLIKPGTHHGDWWRLFTAPFLHGNLLHFLMNASALLYLGKRIETFARWPHVALVFLLAAIVGGEASSQWIRATSVGASGGLMGWLGFLLVFESRHPRLVPRPASRRLFAGVTLTLVIGLIGYRFIDNAAHIGGCLAGILYGLAVFPRSTSVHRPTRTLTDTLAGLAALAILALAALHAVRQILGP